MREFILYNESKTQFFHLSKNGILVTEPKGLGNSFSTTYHENEKSKYLSNIKNSFEDISFKIYFNADGSNAYANYKNLLMFLNSCGLNTIILEYNDGITKKRCNIIIKKLPKSEINEDGLLEETFIFERLTYWYKEEKISFTLKTVLTNETFPMQFPFGFIGQTLEKEMVVTNDFFEEIPIEIKITGEIEGNITIFIADLNGNRLQEIELQTGCKTGKVITISSFNTKKVLVTEGGKTINGYDLIKKDKQSFLYLKPGKYVIGTDLKPTDEGNIDISLINYLLD